MSVRAMCITLNVDFRGLIAAVPRPSPKTFSDTHSKPLGLRGTAVLINQIHLA